MNKAQVMLAGFFLLGSLGLSAQNKLHIQGSAPDLYLKHVVVSGENWYSIGRRYNLPPREIAAFNQQTIETPLRIAAQLRIPLTETNFVQQDAPVPDEALVPLYHQVAHREWLYRISTRYRKVPVATLEKWNQVSNQRLREGMWLVVGYLKVKPGISPLAVSAAVRASGTSAANAPAKPESASAALDPERKGVSSNNDSPGVKATVSVLPPPPNHKGGVFKRLYEETGSTVSGNAAIFKSTSGWNDGKYYALMNGVPVGTIVKVNFSSTNKNIYAKVLGQLPEMRENAGISLRISDAAAAELGATNSKFFVDIRY